MPVTDTTATAFVNKWLRPGMDRHAQTYNYHRALLQQWNGGLSAFFSSNDGTIVEDGAENDNRQVVTTADVNNGVNRALEHIASVEAPGALDTVIKLAVNTIP